MPAFKFLRYEVTDRILTITLDRPEKMNAVTPEMNLEIVAAFDEADADDNVRVIVMTGNGRAFCAGSDLSGGAGAFDYADDDPQAERDFGGLVSLRIFESTKPVIAAINGAAVGQGVTMTLPMDIRLCSTNARFGFVFTRRGIVPEACSTWFLPRVAGIAQATEWIYSGRVFDAAEAHAGGLVRSVHEPAELLPAAYTLAHEIADNTSAVSVALARQMLWRHLGSDHPMEAHRLESKAVTELGKMADAREGVASFLEKRAPSYTLSPRTDMPSFYPWWPERPFTPARRRES